MTSQSKWVILAEKLISEKICQEDILEQSVGKCM